MYDRIITISNLPATLTESQYQNLRFEERKYYRKRETPGYTRREESSIPDTGFFSMSQDDDVTQQRLDEAPNDHYFSGFDGGSGGGSGAGSSWSDDSSSSSYDSGSSDSGSSDCGGSD